MYGRTPGDSLVNRSSCVCLGVMFRLAGYVTLYGVWGGTGIRNNSWARRCTPLYSISTNKVPRHLEHRRLG